MLAVELPPHLTLIDLDASLVPVTTVINEKIYLPLEKMEIGWGSEPLFDNKVFVKSMGLT